MAPLGAPSVLVGVPYAKDFPGPFVASLCDLLEKGGPDYRATTALVPNTAVHVARSILVKEALRQGSDYLLMVDSDQVFDAGTLKRLLRWREPAVTPVIVARQGDPVPVAYAEEGRDVQGNVHYAHLADEVWAYLSQFDPERLQAPFVDLPLTPDHAPAQADMPLEVEAGLQSPLLACDALGTGMVLLKRELLLRVQPDAKGFYFDWERGGEDLSFFRRVREAGYLGFRQRQAGIWCDRGCVVGHLSYYARGAVDLGRWLAERSRKAPAEADEATILEELAEELAEDGARATPGPWQDEPLPESGYVRERFR